MKNIYTLILLIAGLQLSAQENIEIKQILLAIDTAMQPAFVVAIPQTKGKEAVKMWENRLVSKNLFSTFKKLPKMEKYEQDKWHIHGVVVEEISEDTLSIYTHVNELKDHISFTALFSNNEGFLGGESTNPELNSRISGFLRSHAIEVYKQAVQDEIDDLQKKLKKMENEYDSYNKDNRKLDRKSTDSQSNLSVLNVHSAASENTSAILSEEQMEEKLKEIKKEEKALKKYTKKMDKNSSKQEKLAREIKKLEKEIKTVEQKLNNIK